MKFCFAVMAPLLIFISCAKAETDSACHHSCYKNKQACNYKKSHTFNGCHEELFMCKASCITGKTPEAFRTTIPIDVTFNPVFDFEA
ncbi:MAG: hypothetical protein KBD90_02015 [Alphaproteobacteria bacterium]|nr:hypothetical protein [Alphaproteobacteria bacterium]